MDRPGRGGRDCCRVTPAYPAQAIRSRRLPGNATAQRRVVSLDYGITWQATKTIALSDQVDFSNVHQPGVSNISAGVTQNTPTNPNETINYSARWALVPLTVLPAIPSALRYMATLARVCDQCTTRPGTPRLAPRSR